MRREGVLAYDRSPARRKGCKKSGTSVLGPVRLALRPAADARAVAQELLHLALVAVRRAVATQPGHAQVLREALDGLARRVAQPVAGGLELAIVETAAVAQLLRDLVGDADAHEAEAQTGQA